MFSPPSTPPRSSLPLNLLNFLFSNQKKTNQQKQKQIGKKCPNQRKGNKNQTKPNMECVWCCLTPPGYEAGLECGKQCHAARSPFLSRADNTLEELPVKDGSCCPFSLLRAGICSGLSSCRSCLCCLCL